MTAERTAQEDAWITEAHDLGVKHARAVATWITDGNDSDESRRRKLEIIEADGAYAILRAPNLSGEYADDLTTGRLFEYITGLDAHASATFNIDALAISSYASMLNVADAYEDGVSEAFESACVDELNRWLS